MRWSNSERRGEPLLSRLDNQDSCSGFDSPAASLDELFEHPAGPLPEELQLTAMVKFVAHVSGEPIACYAAFEVIHN